MEVEIPSSIEPARLVVSAKFVSSNVTLTNSVSGEERSGDDRDRTGNLLLAKQALSRLSYVPKLSILSSSRLLTTSRWPDVLESSIIVHVASRVA